jgi:hypothetical protein
MPEIRECIAHFIWILCFFDWCNLHDINLQLLGLWADASEAEAPKLAPDGLVYRLNSSSTVQRGSRGSQTSLWPLMCRLSPKNPNPLLIETLVWKGVENAHTCRAVILNFGELYLQVSPTLFHLNHI